MSIWRWRHLAADVAQDCQITLGEGDTPLVRSRHLGPAAGLPNLFFKLETANPTGSFKDRFAAAAISDMLSQGKRRCIATSSGNTGSSLAAYCAAAGIDCRIAIVETAPDAKLRQMMAYGARIYRVRHFGIDAEFTDRVFTRLVQLAAAPDAALQISSVKHCPTGMRGVESISCELAEQIEGQLDHVFCPAGGGGLCVAVADGFVELQRQQAVRTVPAVHCVQPEGNDTMASALRNGDQHARSVQCTSKISGLQVASVVDGDLVIQRCRPTGGLGHLVSDAEVANVQMALARDEGIFSEPAGAVALAGALNAAAHGEISPSANIVCLVTGIGFKDDASVTTMIADRSCPTIGIESLDQYNLPTS